jgi:diguanylate cyclase (GGDEF)-like protein
MSEMDSEGPVQRLAELTASASRMNSSRDRGARAAAEQGCELAERLGDRSRFAENLYVLGSSLVREGDYPRSETELRRALALAEELNDKPLMVKVLRALLQAAFFTRNMDAALLRGMQALQLARESGERSLEGQVQNDVGLIYGHFGDFEGALQHLLSGLRILRETGSDRLSSLLNNIGNVYLELDDHQEALHFFRMAFDEFQAAGDQRACGIAAGNIGRALTCLNRDEEALAAYRSSLEHYHRSDDAAYMPPARARLALGLNALGQCDAADEEIEQALQLLERSRHREFGEEVISAAGRILLSRGRLQQAIVTLNQALAILPSGESTRRLYELHHALYEAHEGLGDLEGALRHYKQFTRARLAVSDSAITVRTRGLMLEFDVERARQQEEIFRLRNVELARANADLQELQKQLETSNQELHRISIEDSLTGLYNRRFIDAQISTEVGRSKRYTHPLCVAMCDIDHFKAINDRYSHALGDEVLRITASILRETTRLADVVSRYGGEEFFLILPETELDGATVLADRIRTSISDYPWSDLAEGLKVTISIGVAELRQDGAVDRLMADADARLYAAKQAGRDCVVA